MGRKQRTDDSAVAAVGIAQFCSLSEALEMSSAAIEAILTREKPWRRGFYAPFTKTMCCEDCILGIVYSTSGSSDEGRIVAI